MGKASEKLPIPINKMFGTSKLAVTTSYSGRCYCVCYLYSVMTISNSHRSYADSLNGNCGSKQEKYSNIVFPIFRNIFEYIYLFYFILSSSTYLFYIVFFFYRSSMLYSSMLYHPCCGNHLQVSTTRLAIRNIPSSWDEQKLRAVFIAGVKERATKEKPQVKQVCVRAVK